MKFDTNNKIVNIKITGRHNFQVACRLRSSVLGYVVSSSKRLLPSLLLYFISKLLKTKESLINLSGVFYRNIHGLCKQNNCFVNRPEGRSATSCPLLSRRLKILYCSYLLGKVSLL